MKITVDYLETTSPTELKVQSADYLADFVLRIHFNDSSEQLVDFKHFLQMSAHPAIKKYQNEELFKNFRIIDGNLNWNDFDMIFPIEDLYNGQIVKSRSSEIIS